MQLSQGSRTSICSVARHGTPCGVGPDRGGGTPRPGRFGEAQSNSRITRSAASDAVAPLPAGGAIHQAVHNLNYVGGSHY
jgi:hypothetical protein